MNTAPSQAPLQEELSGFLRELGTRIKAARKKMNLSQAKASEAMQIDYRHYQNIEGGKINLRLDTLIKLFRFYRLSGDTGQEQLSTFTQMLGGDSSTTSRSGGHWIEGLLRRPQTAALSVDPNSARVMAATDSFAQLLGYESSTDVVGRSVESLFRAQDWLNFKASVLETLPPSNPPSQTLYALHRSLPSLLKVIAVPQWERSGADRSVLTLAILTRESLTRVQREIEQLQSNFNQVVSLCSGL